LVTSSDSDKLLRKAVQELQPLIRLLKVFPSSIRKLIGDHLVETRTAKNLIELNRSQMDWSKTKCFYVDPNEIIINLMGRQPSGIVRQHDYKALKSQIIRHLIKLNESVDSNIISSVHSREEVFWGPFTENGPDILLVANEDCLISPKLSPERGYVRRVNTHYHKPEGLFLAYGPEVRKVRLKSKVKCYDIAPTILHVLNEDIPTYMDGRVLKEIFRDGNELKTWSIRTVEADLSSEKGHYKYTREEQDELTKRLKKLGYLG